MLKALIAAATGSVTSHANIIDRKRVQSTDFAEEPSSLPKTYPTNTTLPTMQWVLEMGIPSLLASSTVMAAEVSTVKPLSGRKKKQEN